MNKRTTDRRKQDPRIHLLQLIYEVENSITGTLFEHAGDAKRGLNELRTQVLQTLKAQDRRKTRRRKDD